MVVLWLASKSWPHPTNAAGLNNCTNRSRLSRLCRAAPSRAIKNQGVKIDNHQSSFRRAAAATDVKRRPGFQTNTRTACAPQISAVSASSQLNDVIDFHRFAPLNSRVLPLHIRVRIFAVFSDEAVDARGQQGNRLREVLQPIAWYRDSRLGFGSQHH